MVSFKRVYLMFITCVFAISTINSQSQKPYKGVEGHVPAIIQMEDFAEAGNSEGHIYRSELLDYKPSVKSGKYDYANFDIINENENRTANHDIEESINNKPTTKLEPRLQALVDFYHAMDGPNWKNNTGWKDDIENNTVTFENLIKHKWVGLKYDEEKTKIIELRFVYNNLKGQVPESIGDLKNLKKLTLFRYSGNMGSTIPNSIYTLTDLEVLQTRCAFTGPVSEGILKLKKLKSLTLGYNGHNQPFPHYFSKLVNLEKLDLYGSKFTGTLPRDLGNLKKLKAFNITNNKITGGLPASINQMTELESFVIHNNPLGGTIPSLNNLTNLRFFGASNCGFKGRLTNEFDNINGLEYFQLYHNKLYGTLNIKGDQMKYYRVSMNFFNASEMADTYIAMSKDKSKEIVVSLGQFHYYRSWLQSKEIKTGSKRLTIEHDDVHPQNTYQWYFSYGFQSVTTKRYGMDLTGQTNSTIDIPFSQEVLDNKPNDMELICEVKNTVLPNPDHKFRTIRYKISYANEKIVISDDIVKDGLILHYDIFKEGGLENGSSKLKDLSNSGNDMVLTSEVKKEEGHLFFPDKEIPNLVAKNVDIKGDDKFSMGFWIRPTMFVNYNLSIGASKGWNSFLFMANRLGSFYTGISSNQNYRIESGSRQKLSLNKWHYIVFTYNGQTAKTYINGVPVLTKNIQTPMQPWEGFRIGKMGAYLDVVQLYKNKTLTDDEVLQNMSIHACRYFPEACPKGSVTKLLTQCITDLSELPIQKVGVNQNSKVSLKGKLVVDNTNYQWYRVNSSGKDQKIIDNKHYPEGFSNVYTFKVEHEPNTTAEWYSYLALETKKCYSGRFRVKSMDIPIDPTIEKPDSEGNYETNFPLE